MGYPCVALVYNMGMAEQIAYRGHGWAVSGLNPDYSWPLHSVIVC